jgi:hypothetical protein
MHQGCELAPAKAGGERRVVADIARLSVEREAYYTRELATDHEQHLSEHGESPGRWYGAGANARLISCDDTPVEVVVVPDSHAPESLDIAEWTRRSRERQGLPAHVTDVIVLAKLATLVRAPVTPSTPRGSRSGRTHVVRGRSGQSQSVR